MAMRAIVMTAAVALVPVGAWGQTYPVPDYSVTSQETIQRQSIESDIRNGRPAAEICNKARNAAGVLDNAEFKEWAYGVAREQCAKAEAGDGGGISASAAATSDGEPTMVVNGITVPLCSSGMPCLGQLRRAMGIWE